MLMEQTCPRFQHTQAMKRHRKIGNQWTELCVEAELEIESASHQEEEKRTLLEHSVQLM